MYKIAIPYCSAEKFEEFGLLIRVFVIDRKYWIAPQSTPGENHNLIQRKKPRKRVS